MSGLSPVMPDVRCDASATIAAFPCNHGTILTTVPPGHVNLIRHSGNALLAVTVNEYRKTGIRAYVKYSTAGACTKNCPSLPISLLAP